MRDQQRSKVYDWEQKTFGVRDEKSTLKQCEEMARHIQTAYGKKWRRLEIKCGAGFRRAVAYPNAIYLPKWARNEIVVLHEMAHWILVNDGVGCDHHGPKFMRLFIELIAWAIGLPKSEILSSARAKRIKIAPATTIPKRVGPYRAPALIRNIA